MTRLPLWTRKIYVSADRISFIGSEDGLRLIYLDNGHVIRDPDGALAKAQVGDFYVMTGCGDVSIWPADQFRAEHIQSGASAL